MSNHVATVADALHDATCRLTGDCPRSEAELLLAAALGSPRSWLYAHPEACLTEDQGRDYRALVARRALGEPVAQILGCREFWSLPLIVTPDTLIPRPETELLVECALRRLPDVAGAAVLDLGTGSGAVALAIANERPGAVVTGVDVSARALAVARGNGALLRLDRVEFLLGDWLSAVGGRRFEVIVGNPPYIAEGDPHLRNGDLRFEPRLALASGADGLDAIRQIVAQAPKHLSSSGWLLLEHGWQQGSPVRELFGQAGFTSVHTQSDLGGNERVTLGQWLVPGN